MDPILIVVFAVGFVLFVGYLYVNWGPGSKSKAGRIGTIRNFRKGTKGIYHQSVTLFEICLTDGHIYYAAIDGHVDDLKEDDTLEFWPEWSNSIAVDSVYKKQDNPDGTVSRWKEEVRYYGFRKYRVIPGQEAPK